MEFSSSNVFTVVNEIHKMIFSSSHLLKETGVFRESGNMHHVEFLIAHILKSEQKRITSMTIHDYIGALKHVLLNRDDKFSNQVFQHFISDLQTGNASTGIDQLLMALVHSEQQNNIHLAESLYNYIQIIRLTAGFQQENGMDAKNLGLMLGPVLSISETMDDVAFLNDYSAQIIQSDKIPVDQKFIEYVADNFPHMLTILLKSKQQALRIAIQELSITTNVIDSSIKILAKQNDFIEDRTMQLEAVEKSIQQQKAKLANASKNKPLRQELTGSIIEAQKHAMDLVLQIKIKIADRQFTEHLKQNATNEQSVQKQKVRGLRVEIGFIKKRIKNRTVIVEDWSNDFEQGASSRIKRVIKKLNQSRDQKEASEGPVFFKRPIKNRHAHDGKAEAPEFSR